MDCRIAAPEWSASRNDKIGQFLIGMTIYYKLQHFKIFYPQLMAIYSLGKVKISRKHFTVNLRQFVYFINSRAFVDLMRGFVA